jgi:cytochrome c oxidase subunit 1
MFDNLVDINEFVTYAAILGAFAQVIFLINFFYSMLRGERATANPWNSNTLEWTNGVGHYHGNWKGALPVVHRWAYDYSKPGKENDFVPQTVPLEADEHDGGGHH